MSYERISLLFTTGVVGFNSFGLDHYGRVTSLKVLAFVGYCARYVAGLAQCRRNSQTRKDCATHCNTRYFFRFSHRFVRQFLNFGAKIVLFFDICKFFRIFFYFLLFFLKLQLVK